MNIGKGALPPKDSPIDNFKSFFGATPFCTYFCRYVIASTIGRWLNSVSRLSFSSVDPFCLANIKPYVGSAGSILKP